MASATKERHPPGLFVLFFTEMWERFGFYSMLAMFTLYLKDDKKGFGWSSEDATKLYANYLMFVYASPLIGGWIADKKLGYRNSVLLGGVIFMFGYFLLSIHEIWAVYAALTCLVVGNGFFKPNVSAMVGHQYPEGSKLKDRAYNIFYMGINIGALLAPINAEIWVKHIGFNNAFAIAGFGMIISVVILWCFRHRVEGGGLHSPAASPDPARPEAANPEAETPTGPTLAAPRKENPIDQVPERTRITALLVIFAIVIVFWMIFHQNGSTLTYWADDNTDWQVSGIIANAINPFWVVTLTFPVVWMWGWLNRRGLEPSTPMKMTIGMFLVAVTFVLLFTVARMGEGQEVTEEKLAVGDFRITDRSLDSLKEDLKDAKGTNAQDIIDDLNRKNSKGKPIIKGKKFATDKTYEDAFGTIMQAFAADLELAKADLGRYRDEEKEFQDILLQTAQAQRGKAEDDLKRHRQKEATLRERINRLDADVKALNNVAEAPEGKLLAVDKRGEETDEGFEKALEKIIKGAKAGSDKYEKNLSSEGKEKMRSYARKKLTGREKLQDALARRDVLGRENADKYGSVIEKRSYLFKVSPLWLILAYAIVTLAELMLSPMGLSLVSKVAPVRLRGLMMGGWFVATAIGNKLTAIGVYWEIWKQSTFFLVLGCMAAGMGLVLVLCLRSLKKAMPGV
jgi:POT family proton-dependent oligopeptide transporter